MIKVILVAHGRLAHEMKASAEMIFGELPSFQSIEFLKEEGLESIQEKIHDEIKEDIDYLILTDLFCGTPYNASCAVAMTQTDRRIEIMSGMSLPLVLEAASMVENANLSDIVNYLIKVSHEVVKKFELQEFEEEDF